MALEPSRTLTSQTLQDRIRQRLAGLGLCEAYNYDFISDKHAGQARLQDRLPRVKNPLSEDYANLRPTLLVGLLQSARINLNNGAEAIRLFELGKVYTRASDGISENAHAAGLLLGPTQRHWSTPRSRKMDFFDVKGILEELLAGIPGWQWQPLSKGSPTPSDPLFHPRAGLRLSHPKGVLGTAALLHPVVARAWDLEAAQACLFDLDLDLLAKIEGSAAHFEQFSVFPGSNRDLSLLVEAGVRFGDLLAAIRGAGVMELRETELVDKFTGQGVPAGKQSLTVRLHFGLPDRTLKDAEVSAAVERILAELQRSCGAALRS